MLTVIEPLAEICQTLFKEFGRKHLLSRLVIDSEYGAINERALCSTLSFIRAPINSVNGGE